MGCSRGVPGCSGLFRGSSGGVPGCSGGVPGCSGVFRGVPGVFRVLQTPVLIRESCEHEGISTLPGLIKSSIELETDFFSFLRNEELFQGKTTQRLYTY